ncbi:MAG: hypothetical protein ACOCZQ_02790 [Nanoarchaeota archaeon]
MVSKKNYIKGGIAALAAGLALGYAAKSTDITNPEFKYLNSDRDRGVITSHGLETFGRTVYNGKSREVGIDKVVANGTMWNTFEKEHGRHPYEIEKLAMKALNPEYPNVQPEEKVKLAYLDD